MQRTKKAVEIIENILQVIDKPPQEIDEITKEVAQMGFKIRAVSGKLSRLHLLNGNILRSLWKIGKIEEIVEASFDELNRQEKDQLIDYLDHLEEMDPYVGVLPPGTSTEAITLEIFKDSADILVN